MDSFSGYLPGILIIVNGLLNDSVGGESGSRERERGNGEVGICRLFCIFRLVSFYVLE